MDIFLYVMLFIMGTFFGSFFTLAVYRIPLKKDITHEHSFCPDCNHKLGVLDLIPIWSYLALRGKCRYCGEKVRIRYLLLEVLSGFVFVIVYFSLNLQNIFFDTDKLIYFVAFVALYVTLVLVSGIDKEYRKINPSILLFGILCQAGYMLYLYIIEATSMYRYYIYLGVFLILFIACMILRKKKKEIYWLEILLLFSYILLVLNWKATLVIFILSFVVIAIWQMISKTKYQKIPFGFVIGISTIVCAIVENFIEFWIV